MTSGYDFLEILPIVIAIVVVSVVKYIKRANLQDAYKKLNDLNDCPFQFTLDISEYRDYAIFDLGEAKLWCEYKFGVRSDGIYGVKELNLVGINGVNQRDITLKTGQSIFPIILKVEEFENWTKTKSFKVFWESEFSSHWQITIKGLDNLKYLETKSKEKDNGK